jgi:hypothetical protein
MPCSSYISLTFDILPLEARRVASAELCELCFVVSLRSYPFPCTLLVAQTEIGEQ